MEHLKSNKIYQLTLLAIILATNFDVQAKLVNGFSDIRAENRKDRSSRLQASDNRIAEEIGKPITVASFKKFLERTQNFINQSKPDLQIAVAAVVDLFRAFKQLSQQEQSELLASDLQKLKSKLETFKLGRMQTLLDDMAQ